MSVSVLIPQTGLQIFLVLIALLSVPVLLLGKPLYLYWLYRGGKGLRRRRVRPNRSIQTCLKSFANFSKSMKINRVVSPQGYERVRRVSEDDNSTPVSYEEDEEEGIDEVPSREALPKQVRDQLQSCSYDLCLIHAE